MYVVDEKKLKLKKKMMFIMYISLISITTILSLVSWGLGLDTRLMSTIVAIFIFIFNGTKDMIISDFLIVIWKSDYKVYKKRKYVLNAIGNMPLIVSVVIILCQYYVVNKNIDYKVALIRVLIIVLFSLVIIMIASLIKWFLQADQKITCFDPKSIWDEIDQANDDIIDILVTGYEGHDKSEQFISDYEEFGKEKNLLEFSKTYKWLERDIYAYYIELRQTKFNNRYYLVYGVTGKSPFNFMENDFKKIVKHNSSLNLSIPMYAVDRDMRDAFVLDVDWKNNDFSCYLKTLKKEIIKDWNSLGFLKKS